MGGEGRDWQRWPPGSLAAGSAAAKLLCTHCTHLPWCPVSSHSRCTTTRRTASQPHNCLADLVLLPYPLQPGGQARCDWKGGAARSGGTRRGGGRGGGRTPQGTGWAAAHQVVVRGDQDAQDVVAADSRGARSSACRLSLISPDMAAARGSCGAHLAAMAAAAPLARLPTRLGAALLAPQFQSRRAGHSRALQRLPGRLQCVFG